MRLVDFFNYISNLKHTPSLTTAGLLPYSKLSFFAPVYSSLGVQRNPFKAQIRLCYSPADNLHYNQEFVG